MSWPQPGQRANNLAMKANFAVYCWVGWALATVPAVHAAVYHCVRDGRQVYTDTPCTPASSPAQLPQLNRADPATGSGGLATQFDRDAARAHQQRDRDDAAWLKAYQAKKARDAAIRKGLAEGRVVEGMTPADVERVLGEPESVVDDAGVPRRWNYRNGRVRKTVTFKDGHVSSIHTSGTHRR